MANFSKLLVNSVCYNCYEVAHTWSPSCGDAALGLGYYGFIEGLKVYTPLYLLSQILQKRFDLKSVYHTVESIWISSLFLGFIPFAFLFSICIFRKAFGKFYYLSGGFLPGFVANFFGFFIERESRRGPLSLYTAYVATETLFRMAVARKMVKPIPGGEVYLFCAVIASLMYINRKHGLSKDLIGMGIKHIVGVAEFSPPVIKRISEPREKATKALSRKSSMTLKAILSKMRVTLSKIWSVIKHRSCPHNNSCFRYAVEGFIRPFLIGYVANLSIRCLSSLSYIAKNPAIFKKFVTDRRTANIGLFLGAFAGTFRLLNCVLRWLFGENKEVFVIPAAFVAGLFMKISPSPTIALYLSWKLAEVLYLMGLRKGILPEVKSFRLILYSVSAGIMFHAAVYEPQNLKPEYWKFLKKVSHGRFEIINRPVLFVLGTLTMQMYRDFNPDLDLKYISRNFLETYLLWTIH